MNSQTDAQLLRAYAENRSETAFTELVRRHVDLVHSAALRMVCDSHLAQDVTQAAFIALAKSASQLTERAVLSGWLYRTAQNIAAQTVRTDTRRRVREQEAAVMNELLSAKSETSWEAIAPHLDAALGELNDADRDALLLRYFEKKSALEMAGILGISGEAAQKRVSRAVERLRELFSKRGVRGGAGGLVLVITANAVQGAPVGLAAAISAAALASTAVSTSTLIAATKTIAMTTLQKTFIAATVAVLAGAGIYEAHQAARLREQNQALQLLPTPLTEQNDQLQRQLAAATNRLAETLAENSLLKSNRNEMEMLKLRGEISRLQEANARPAQADSRQELVKSWLEREDQLKQAVKQNPDKSIPELNLLSEQDWLNAAMNAKFGSDKELRQALANLRHTGENIFAQMASDAVSKYMAANSGHFPAYLSDLLPYFKTPPDAAILDRWEILPQSAIPNQRMGGDWVITEKAPVDADYDNRWAIGPGSFGSSNYQPQDISAAIATITPAMKAYAADNDGRQPDNPSEIQPYLTTSEQQAAYQKLMQKYGTNAAAQ